MAYWVGKKTQAPQDAVTPTSGVDTTQADSDGDIDTQGEGSTELKICLRDCRQNFPIGPERQQCLQECRDRYRNGDDNGNGNGDGEPECTKNLDCPQGYKCVNGECVSREPWKGCPHGKWFTHFPNRGPCPEGYHLVKRPVGGNWEGSKPGADGRCECDEYDPPGPGPGPDVPDDMGEFEFPPGLKEYYDMMMARGKELLGMPVGYTQDMITKMYGKDFELLRGREGAQREATTRLLSREGGLGTGAGREALSNIGVGTEQNIASSLRDIFIESEKQKKTDILAYTGMAQDVFAGGQNYWMLQEAANAARRGDMFRSLELLLKYYGIAVAGWGG